jgi:hypothetical protein
MGGSHRSTIRMSGHRTANDRLVAQGRQQRTEVAKLEQTRQGDAGSTLQPAEVLAAAGAAQAVAVRTGARRE